MTLTEIYDEYTPASEGFIIAVETHCGFFIDRDQIERIAERAKNASEFQNIWENEDWWVSLQFPVHLNEAGQAHIAEELNSLGLDWDLDGVCSEIENKIGFNEIRYKSEDTYDYEITKNEASRAGLCQAGYGGYAYIEITADMVQFEKADQ